MKITINTLKVLLIFTVFSFISCDKFKQEIREQEIILENERKNAVEFNEVGYFKSNNLRYKTFHISSPSLKNKDSIPKIALEKIKEHGANQMNSSGNITASFYYLKKENTPDITNSINAKSANDIAHEKKPIAAVWIMPNGNINFIKKP